MKQGTAVSYSAIMLLLSIVRVQGFSASTARTTATRTSRRIVLPHRQTRLLATTTTSSTSSSTSTSTHDLLDPIRTAWTERETDGILDLVQQETVRLSAVSPTDLVQTSVQALGSKGASNKNKKGNKGKIAAVLNAWIGSCSLLTDVPFAADYASQLLQAYDDLSDNNENENSSSNKAPVPDMVALCLAYNSLIKSPAHQSKAEDVLERAVRTSKKAAGSRRRKALVAARRKPFTNNLLSDMTALTELQRLIPKAQVLTETDDYIAVHKPAGVACYFSQTTTAGKISKKRKTAPTQQQDVSLQDALLHINVPLSTLNDEALGLVHRLDRGTAGCMLWAKTEHFHALAVSAFFLRQAQKTYTTLVAPTTDGNTVLDTSPQGDIDLPVDGRPAQSSYKVLERYGSAAARLELQTWTGRKHQVRVHCAKALSCPVLWDDAYGDASTSFPAWSLPDERNRQRFFLHASKLSIPLLDVHAEAPLPSWWTPVLEKAQTAI